MQAIRDKAGDRGVFQNQAENPLVELLFGGLQTVPNRTDWMQAELQVADSELRLTLATPFSADWMPEARQWYFGPEAAGQVPAVPQAAGLLGSFGMYRNVSEMWQRAGDLFSADMNDRMAEAESIWGPSLAVVILVMRCWEHLGRSCCVAAVQDFSARADCSRDSAACLRTGSDAAGCRKMRPELRRAFQSAIGFFNITGIQEGRPQLDMDMQKSANSELIISRYLPPKKPTTGQVRPSL
jgi:hypothetical protein